MSGVLKRSCISIVGTRWRIMAEKVDTVISDGDFEHLADNWMIRPCEAYMDEFKECKSYKGRFQQYYIAGEYKDCSKWKEDMENCYKYRTERSLEAGIKVIKSEKERKAERLHHARNNDIWEYRTVPPEDWAKPLPENLEKMKLPKMKTGEESGSICTIS